MTSKIAHRHEIGMTDQALQDVQTELENLDDLHHRLCRMIECGHIHAQELARLYPSARSATASSLLDPHVISDFHEHHALPSPRLSETGEGHERLLAHLYPQISAGEQLCFYRQLTEEAGVDPATLTARLLGHTEPIESFARGTIAYQHSIYTDEAFLHFSRVLPAARAVYTGNFVSVCEQVFNGLCEYCILPLENTQDGKLVRFYQLIEKFELKIVLTCSVTTSDNRNSTVFGLCRRGLSYPQLFLPERGFCFEFIFWQEPEHLTLSQLLTAAAASALTLSRADCLPPSDEEILIGAGYPFDLCFEVAPGGGSDPTNAQRDFLAFVLYLSVNSPTYLPLGIYQRL